MKINYKGRVHFQEWYKLIYALLVSKGFTSTESGDANFEDYLSHLVNSNGTVNNWIWWRSSRVSNEMFTHVIDIDFQVLLLQNVEVMHHGKKLKVNDGETNLNLRSKLIIDPKGVWKKNWFTREIYDLLQRKHFKDQILQEKIKLYDDALEIHDRAKQALGCMTLEPREAFHIDEKAFPDV